MPIEIKELHISVTVEGTAQAPSSGTQAAGKTREDDKAALIAECVEQVLQILQNKEER